MWGSVLVLYILFFVVELFFIAFIFVVLTDVLKSNYISDTLQSKGVDDMKNAVIYSNEKGNTRMLADFVADTLGKDNVCYFGLPSDEAVNADRVYVGFWTDQGTADKLSAQFLNKLKNKEIFLFGSAGYGDSKYFEEILSATKQNLDPTNSVVGEFMCQGKMKMSVRERYVAMKNSDNPPQNVDMLIDNFDEALKHPNDEDLEKLKAEILKTL